MDIGHGHQQVDASLFQTLRSAVLDHYSYSKVATFWPELDRLTVTFTMEMSPTAGDRQFFLDRAKGDERPSQTWRSPHVLRVRWLQRLVSVAFPRNSSSSFALLRSTQRPPAAGHGRCLAAMSRDHVMATTCDSEDESQRRNLTLHPQRSGPPDELCGCKWITSAPFSLISGALRKGVGGSRNYS